MLVEGRPVDVLVMINRPIWSTIDETGLLISTWRRGRPRRAVTWGAAVRAFVKGKCDAMLAWQTDRFREFARVVRYRDDRTADKAGTIDMVRAIRGG